MSRKCCSEVCDGVAEMVFVGVDVAVGGCIAGNHLHSVMVVLEGGGEQALGDQRREIRAREADRSSASATPSLRLLSPRPLHNMVELATVLVREPGQRTSVRQ